MCSKTKVFFFPYVCLVSFSRPALLQGGQIRPVLCVYWSPWQPFSRDSQQSLSPQKESHFIFLYPKSICIFDNWYQRIYFTFKNEKFQLDEKILCFFFAVKFSYNYFPLLVFELSVIYTVIDIGCPIRKRMEKADMIWERSSGIFIFSDW